jgi:hypothetical protein
MDNFWSKVEKTDGCWFWRAAKTYNNYGRFNYKGRIMGAHQVSYILAHGDIPDKLWVLHTCDHRDCVNPEHLFLGTRQENMDDMAAKGRSARGMRNANAKLTDEQVLTIRSLVGEHSQAELCRMFNISPMQMSRIVRGLRWKHLL